MKKSIHKIIIISFLLLFAWDVFSQQFIVKTYTIENGLPTRNINDATQDSNGIMWFATNYGISEYDGFSFTNYDKKNSLPNRAYRKIKMDEKGILWAMPGSVLDTIVFLKDNRWGKINPPDKSTPNYQTNSFDVIYKNNKPVICLGCYNGFYIYENNAWTHFTISKNERLNYVYTVIANNQKFYLSTKMGLCVFDKGKPDWSLTKLIQPYGVDIIAINFQNRNTPDEKIWVLNEKWLGYIQNNTFTLVTNKFLLPHPSIFYYSYVNCDKRGYVFFGNIWAKYYISGKNDTPVSLMYEKGFSSNGATSIFIDREQNIWFTDTRGINKMNNLNVINYFKKDGMLEDEVTAIAEMNDGRIVLGHNNGLSILDKNTFKNIEFPDLGINTRRVGDMMKDLDGNIWFASISNGVGRLQPNGKITWYHSEKFPITNDVHQDRDGRIWVGADTKLLYIKNNVLTEYLPFKNKNSTIRKIFSADKGGIYLAGSAGLWYINDDKTTKIPSDPGIRANNVFAYYKSTDGIEFVGSINGLCYIHNGRIEKFKHDNIEINSPVFFIFQDKDKNFWIGSDNGVYKWDGDDKIEIYNIYNGLAGWETNRAAGMTDSKDRIWIGTDRGLTCFEPGYHNTENPVPAIDLMSFEDRKGIQYPLTEPGKINYTDNSLVFHFRGISFINEDLIEYKYKLKGFDSEWQTINQSMLEHVKYNGLEPGKYTLYVMARNFSGSWSKISRSATIQIRSPYYLTWWFLLSVFIFSGGIIFGIIRIRVQKLHNSGLEKEIAERKVIEQALVESKQKYKDLVELLPETIYETDFSGRILYMNDAGLRLFDFQQTELDTYILIDQLVAPESIEDMRIHMETIYELKKTDRAIMTGMKKDGTEFPVSIHSVPIIYKNKCIGTRGIIINLTEQKKFEDQLQMNAKDLQNLNNSKDKFFSIIAHDLRSPFNSFLGFTEILEEEFETLPKDELKTIISFLGNSARNLFQLLENLLEWSLLQREITQFEPKTTLLYPLVENCNNITIDLARQKKIDIKIDIAKDLEVIADVHMLQTIIRNLLTNAIKFTPRDGHIQISASQDEEHFVTIGVTDTGIGIQEERLKDIFRIDSNNKTKGTDGEVSTGLGLILCKEFVEKHGGKIWVKSETGKGSTFYFTVRAAAL